MFANIVSAIMSSAAVTFALLYIMQALIDLQPGVEVDTREPTPLVWVRVIPPERPPNIIDELPNSEFVDPPKLPPTPRPNNKDGYEIAVGPTAAAPAGPRYEGPGSAWSDGPLVSLIRVTPDYPARALNNGLEGYAVVQFDVLADGSIANVFIVESSDKVFERPSIEAAKRFRFRPRVVDGIPQITTGLQNLFRFEMNN